MISGANGEPVGSAGANFARKERRVQGLPIVLFNKQKYACVKLLKRFLYTFFT